MKFCKHLNGSLNIERDRVQFCCATKHNMPIIPWNIDEELPLDKIRIVREALVNALNGDLDSPVPEYEEHGLQYPNHNHPCKGCRHIIESDDSGEGMAENGQLNNLLHLQAFTYCNARCVYCQLRQEEGGTPLSRGRDLDIAINKAVAQLLEAGAIAPTCQITFSSGEPSLSEGFMKTLHEVVNKGYRVFINTNAICYAPEIEEALRSGRALVQVSLDSGDRDSYLAIKGVDKFDSVASNVERYAAAAINGSTFWVKYIVFSETNSKDKMDKFVEFCLDRSIKNVSVNANYNEGEATLKNSTDILSEKQGDSSDVESLKAFAYLATKLEFAGICVHKEFAHLTQNEQLLAKREYAFAVIKALNFHPHDLESCLFRLIDGLELAALPSDNPRLKLRLTEIFKESVRDSQKGVALFGAGAHARWINCILSEIGITPVVAFDNNPPQKSPFEFLTVKPAQISNYDIDTVIIGSNAYHLNIYSQLIKTPDFSEIRIVDPYLYLPETRLNNGHNMRTKEEACS